MPLNSRSIDRAGLIAVLTFCTAAAQDPKPVAGIPVNYDESKVGSYRLPDPLVLANGKPVRDAKTWFDKRRPELVRLFEEDEYGRSPGRPAGMSFDVFEKDTPAFDGKGLRRQVTIRFAKDRTEPKLDLLIYVPAAARKPVPAGDFSLRALYGRKVRLGELRGKVVLINFLTTWCPACVSEMPELIALQKRHGDKLAIIGVSLDFVPDDHGHIGGHPAVEEQRRHAEEDLDERNSAALKKVRDKVARTAKARGINYPILLDENNEVGGRFNGGELRLKRTGRLVAVVRELS